MKDDIMQKKLLTLAILSALTACGGGGGGSSGSNANSTVNTRATFSGDLSASLALTGSNISGAVTISDPDNAENAARAQTNTATSFGSFTVNTAGQWTYTVDNTNNTLVALGANQSTTDSISISSVDGTTATITITINGINDGAVFNSGEGVDSANINREQNTAITGSLTVTDPDSGESVLLAQDSVNTSYGTFSITQNGAWNYLLDTSNAAVMGLNSPSESIVDEIVVSSVDGSQKTLSITILGTTPSNSQTLAKGAIGDNDTVPEINCDVTYASVSALEDAVSFAMTPGQTHCLAAGDYGDIELKFGGPGTVDAPITVAAAEPGSVTFSGEVSLGMTGSYVVLQGFIFKDGEIGSSILQTRANSNTACNFCRITENAFINMDAGSDNSSKWFQIYGTGNRFDHNWVTGKTTRGALFVIERGDSPGVEDRTQIDHNYFADRPPKDGLAYAENSDNEYEGIRIGSSDTHTSNSFAVIEHNYFAGFDAEAEVISIKAGGVRVSHNTIRNSRGSIVNRHGEGSLIENNFILGDGNPFAGGIRVVDANHQVINNYIQGARNASSNFYGGILVSSSDGSTSNGYQDVENVLIAYNTIVDSVNSINLFAGNEDDKPERLYVVNNVVADAIGPVFKNADEMPINSEFAGNYVYGQGFSDSDDVTSLQGVSFVEPMLEADASGIYRITENSPDLSADTSANVGDYALPVKDMDGQTRSDSTTSGADEISEELLSLNNLRGVLTPSLIGPLSYTPPSSPRYINPVQISNDDFQLTDLSGWTSVGAELTTESTEVFSGGSTVKLNSLGDSLSQTLSVTPNTNYTLSAYIAGPGRLTAVVDGNTYSAAANQDSYRFTTLSFNSGSGTSVVISATVDDSVVLSAPILNSDFDDDQDNWVVNEGTGIGQVQDSDNSASGSDGSIKFKYNDADSGSPYDPYIAQTVTVEPNTEYTLTMYTLLKSSDAQDARVLFGAHTGDAVEGGDFASNSIIAAKDSVYASLSSAEEADDRFRPDTLTFNSGANSQITIFAKYQSTSGDDIRIDDFKLTYVGTPAEGENVFFDSFRLVSHPSL